MEDKIRLGGIAGGRCWGLLPDDPFEAAVEKSLGAAMRADDAVCAALWSALANITWTHASGQTVAYSFRAAGDLITAVLGRGNYLDWYCCGPVATVREDIRAALAGEGWTPSADE